MMTIRMCKDQFIRCWTFAGRPTDSQAEGKRNEILRTTVLYLVGYAGYNLQDVGQRQSPWTIKKIRIYGAAKLVTDRDNWCPSACSITTND